MHDVLDSQSNCESNVLLIKFGAIEIKGAIDGGLSQVNRLRTLQSCHSFVCFSHTAQRDEVNES